MLGLQWHIAVAKTYQGLARKFVEAVASLVQMRHAQLARALRSIDQTGSKPAVQGSTGRNARDASAWAVEGSGALTMTKGGDGH